MAFLRGIYEAHLPVRDLDRALAFYRDKLGLTVGIVDDERKGALLLLDADERSMIGLWEAPEAVFEHPSPRTGGRHTAFRVPLEAVEKGEAWLSDRGIELAEGFGEQPLVHAWMPAASIYFEDPDENLLELIADLPGEPVPGGEPMSLAAWRDHHS